MGRILLEYRISGLLLNDVSGFFFLYILPSPLPSYSKCIHLFIKINTLPVTLKVGNIIEPILNMQTPQLRDIK